MDQPKLNIQRNYPLLRWIGRLWASPNSLLGMFLGSLGTHTWQFHQGMLEILLHNGPVLWTCNRMGISAFTMGDCVIYAVQPDQNLRVHEGRHCYQYWLFGPLFLPIYFLLLFIYGYYDHPFEKDARSWEFQKCGYLYGSRIAQARRATEQDQGTA